MTRILHSRYGVMLAAMLAAGAAWLFASLGQPSFPVADGALVPAWSLRQLHLGAWGLAAGWAVNVVIASLLCYINKAFNLLRGMTMLQGALFLVLEMATPSFFLTVRPGLVLCLAVVLCMLIMYTCYGNANAQRGVFLVFLMLSAGAAIDYAFLLFVPVFVLGCAQMRVFSIRTVMASLMGLATPWIIFYGFGLLGPGSVVIPEFYVSISSEGMSTFSVLLSCAAFTSFVAVAAWVQNIIKLLAYNAQSRAMLSLVNVIMLVAILASLANFTHVGVFLPVINCCASIQLAHLFVNTYKGSRSYLGILCIILIYMAIYAWRLTICIL